METKDTVIKTVSSLWEQLIHAPSHLLLLLVLLCIGVMIKISPIHNRWIPLILMAIGTTLYPLLSSAGNVDPSFRHPMLVLAIYGWLLSVGSIVLHLSLRRLEAFRTMEAAIVNKFTKDDTKFITKDEISGTPPSP